MSGYDTENERKVPQNQAGRYLYRLEVPSGKQNPEE